MTDKEIIFSLECCDNGKCAECSFAFKGGCVLKLRTRAYDLINRQQAEIEICAEVIERQDKEIERLKRENKILSINADNAFQDGLNEAQDLYAEQVENEVRAEAIKEFAERLGNYKEYRYNENCDFVPYVKLSDIEKVVYEMVGVDNESKCE